MAVTLRRGGVEIVCDTERDLDVARKLIPGLTRKKPSAELLAAGQLKHWLHAAWWGALRGISTSDARSELTAMKSDKTAFAEVEERYAIFLRRFAKNRRIKSTDEARVALRSIYKSDHEEFAAIVSKIESMHRSGK